MILTATLLCFALHCDPTIDGQFSYYFNGIETTLLSVIISVSITK